MWRRLLLALVVAVWASTPADARRLAVGPLRVVVHAGATADDARALGTIEQLRSVAPGTVQFTGRTHGLVADGNLIARTGDPAPAGGSYATFGEPTINTVGDVVFTATLDGGPATHGLFLASKGQTSMLVGSTADGPAPRAPDLNATGQVAYRLGTSRLYLLDRGTGQAARLLSAGDAVPGGGTIRRFRDLTIDDDGTIAFVAELTDNAADGSSVGTLVVRSPGGNLLLVARTGGTSPAGGRAYGSLRRQMIAFAPGRRIVFTAPAGDADGVFQYERDSGITSVVALSGAGADGETLDGIGPFVAAAGGGDVFFEATTDAGSRLVRARDGILSLVEAGLLPSSVLYARHVSTTGRTVWTASGDLGAATSDGTSATLDEGAGTSALGTVDVGEVAQSPTGTLAYVVTRSGVYRANSGTPAAILGAGDPLGSDARVRAIVSHAGTTDLSAVLVLDDQGRRVLVVRPSGGEPRVVVTAGAEVTGRGRFGLDGDVLDVVDHRVRFVSRLAARGALGLFEIDADTRTIATLLEPGFGLTHGRRLTDMVLAPTATPDAVVGGSLDDGRTVVVGVRQGRPRILAQAGDRVRGGAIASVAPGGAGSIAGGKRLTAFLAQLADGRSALLASTRGPSRVITIAGRPLHGAGLLGTIGGPVAVEGSIVSAHVQLGANGADDAILVMRGGSALVLLRGGGVAPTGGTFAQIGEPVVSGRTILVVAAMDGGNEHAALLAGDVR